MKAISKELVAGLMLFTTLSAVASDFDYTQPRFEKINICTPHKIMVDDVLNEMDALNPGKLEAKISELLSLKGQKEGDIRSKKIKIDKASKGLSRLLARLDRLTNNMQGEVKMLQKEIAKAENSIADALNDKAKYEKKKDDCRGGVLGTFCRKKYRKKIKEADDQMKKAQAKKIETKKQIANLPKELAALPAKIDRAQDAISKYQFELNEIKMAKPTIVEIETKVDKLDAKLASMNSALEALKFQLAEVEDAFLKCKHMQKLAKAYPVLKKQAKEFKKNPALCENLDTLVDLAGKPSKKKGIIDAHELACSAIVSGAIVDLDTQGPQSEFLDKVIEAPMASNGEYVNNFRDQNYAPKFVDSIEGQGVTQIKFSVEFDIEANYDYLMIKDAAGNVVEKIDGNGQKEVIVDSSKVNIFFYSDGRVGGKGFTIDQIELVKE